MKILPLFIILMIAFHLLAESQTIDSSNFVSDRPGMATPPEVLTKKSVQVEDGFQFEDDLRGIVHTENFLFSSLLIRYGVTKNVEVRVQSDYVYTKEKSTTTTATNGINPITLGFKIGFFKQQKVLPNLSLLLNITLPYFVKKEFRPDHVAPSFIILMSNDITERLNISYNYGMIWNGNSSVPTNFYALCFGATLNNRWSTFIEGYGFSDQFSEPEYYLDAGFAFILNHHLQIDVSVAAYLYSLQNYCLINTGFAWNIKDKPMCSLHRTGGLLWQQQ